MGRVGMGWEWGPYLEMPWREEASIMAWPATVVSSLPQYRADRQGKTAKALLGGRYTSRARYTTRQQGRYCSVRATTGRQGDAMFDIRYSMCDVRCANVDGNAAKEPGSHSQPARHRESQITFFDICTVYSSPAPRFTVLSFQISAGSSTGDPPPGHAGTLGSRFDIYTAH